MSYAEKEKRSSEYLLLLNKFVDKLLFELSKEVAFFIGEEDYVKSYILELTDNPLFLESNESIVSLFNAFKKKYLEIRPMDEKKLINCFISAVKKYKEEVV